MSRRLVDVVNFNADGSCVHADRWLAGLRGGLDSEVSRWLHSFVELKKKVSLGLMGATVADIATFNPEAIALINRHPDLFEIVLRPFSHDIGLLRAPTGFRLNFELGRHVITTMFENVTSYYLPPEFMLTNEQVMLLADYGVSNVFIKADRFSGEAASRIPRRPYRIRGLFDSSLGCVPVLGSCTDAYLASIQSWDSLAWNAAVVDAPSQVVASWRDGESWLLLPDGLARERAWLTGESEQFERVFIDEAVDESVSLGSAASSAAWAGYPVHSFSNWVKEFRMLGFLGRVAEYEPAIEGEPLVKQILWLQAINSDVLSAVEKNAPVVSIRTGPSIAEFKRIVLYRSARGHEGEEYLALLERLDASEAARQYMRESPSPHMQKLRARLDWVEAHPMMRE